MFVGLSLIGRPKAPPPPPSAPTSTEQPLKDAVPKPHRQRASVPLAVHLFPMSGAGPPTRCHSDPFPKFWIRSTDASLSLWMERRQPLHIYHARGWKRMEMVVCNSTYSVCFDRQLIDLILLHIMHGICILFLNILIIIILGLLTYKSSNVRFTVLFVNKIEDCYKYHLCMTIVHVLVFDDMCD